MEPRTWNSTREFLQVIFEDRKTRNSSYSLRAFSRDLGISPGQLNKIMNGKKTLSLEMACKVGLKLNIPQEQFIQLIKAAFEENQRITVT